VNTGHSTHDSKGAKETRESPGVLLEQLEPRFLLNADLMGTAHTVCTVEFPPSMV